MADLALNARDRDLPGDGIPRYNIVRENGSIAESSVKLILSNPPTTTEGQWGTKFGKKEVDTIENVVNAKQDKISSISNAGEINLLTSPMSVGGQPGKISQYYFAKAIETYTRVLKSNSWVQSSDRTFSYVLDMSDILSLDPPIPALNIATCYPVVDINFELISMADRDKTLLYWSRIFDVFIAPSPAISSIKFSYDTVSEYIKSYPMIDIPIIIKVVRK